MVARYLGVECNYIFLVLDPLASIGIYCHELNDRQQKWIWTIKRNDPNGIRKIFQIILIEGNLVGPFLWGLDSEF